MYIYIISSCRTAKLYGIEIHKIMNINELIRILEKYELNLNELDPIFDDRIPEEYKVDANDNIKLIHTLEMKRLESVKKRR